MARIFAYCDSPTAPTGFGRSARHVLHALHRAGHEIVQLAVNHNPATTPEIPWRVYVPTQGGDPYGLSDLVRILRTEPPFDLLWTTFDPECPWAYEIPGLPQRTTVLGLFHSLRTMNPGFRLVGWFPVDAGPLSDFEMAVLGSPQVFDLAATMSSHVHDLIAWTLKLKGHPPANLESIRSRVLIVPHGVEMDRYRVAGEEQRREAKRALGFDPDAFLIVQVERNQPRKMPFNGLALLEKVRQRALPRRVFLYQHMADDEETKGCHVGYRMRELAWRYGLKPDADVRWPARIFTEDEMSDVVYAAADVVFSGSAGEGFQYPLWEALACGRRVLAPRDTARAAWLSHTPGAFLYDSVHDENVIRGSYNRRMNQPVISAAASVVAKMIEGRPKYAECPEASRHWVEERARREFVEKWWTDAVQAQLDQLAADRRRMKATVSDRHDFVVDMRANVGLGDILLAAPALRAFRAAHPGKTVCLALPMTPLHRPLAEWLDMADAIQTQHAIPLPALGAHVYCLSALWTMPHPEWHGFRTHRTDLFAQALDLPPGTDLRPSWTAPEGAVQKAEAEIRHRFGVELSQSIVLACEGAQTNRQLPTNYLLTLCERITAAGITPILVGRIPQPIERVGVVNLTGKLQLEAFVGVLGGARAVVAMDSLPVHVAATLERPTVALMPLYPAAVRLAHYKGPLVVLEPQERELGGETFPAGERGSDAWVQAFRPGRIARALGDLLGDRDLFEPKLVG